MAKDIKAGNLVAKVKSEGVESFDSDMKKAGGSVKAFGGAAGIAAAAVAAAMVGIAKGAVEARKAYKDFEKGMDEVATLVPDLSFKAFNDMERDVQKFSMKYGTLTEEVVPALYQALSAGVPQDNVFEFLEVAQEAAIAGVTELETAVDGISSVVNAYGSDVIDASKTSDLMFTAVKGGKTTFEELSSSLFNVIPTASSMGVAFEDVTSALATLTALGTPTSVATTQMRQAILELSDSGTDLGESFQKTAGSSFRDFIAEGHNMTDVLEIVKQIAKDTNTPINELFGSVEAGSAMLSLTSATGFAKFQESMDAAANSTGATSKAFSEFNDGTGRLDAQLKATWESIKINAGDAVDQLVMEFNAYTDNAIPNLLSGLEETVFQFADSGKMMEWAGIVANDLQDKWEKLKNSFVGQQFQALMEDFKELWRVLKEELAPALGENEGLFEKLGEIMQQITWGQIVLALRLLVNVITVLARGAAWLIEKFSELKTQFMESEFVENLTNLFNSLKEKMDENSDTFESIIELGKALWDLISNVLSIAIQSWIENWNTLKEKAGQAWDWITEKAQGLYNWVEENMPWVIDNIEMLKTVAIGIKDSWVENFNKIKDVILGILPSINQVTAFIMGLNHTLTYGGSLTTNTAGYMRAQRGRQGGGKSVRQLASGGTNLDGGLAMVGEAGPELVMGPSFVNLPDRATVLNNKETQKVMGGNSNSTLNLTVQQAHFTDNAQIRQMAKMTNTYLKFGSIA